MLCKDNNILEPYTISKVDFNNILFKKIKIIKDKKIIFLKYNDEEINNFVIQISKLNEINIINKNEIEIKIIDKKLINFFESLDNYIIETSKNNPSWFDNIDSLNYFRIIRNNNFIKLKIINNEDLKTKLFLNNNKIDDFNDLQNLNYSIKIIMEIYAIYIKKDGFGLVLRPINISLTSNQSYNYEFIEDSDENNIHDESSLHEDLFIKDNSSSYELQNINKQENNNLSTTSSSDNILDDFDRFIK